MTDENQNTMHGLDHSRTYETEDFKNNEAQVEEVTIARLTEEDLFKLSKESLKLWSPTGLRIALIMFVQVGRFSRP